MLSAGLTALSFVSCETFIEFKQEVSEPLLVLHSLTCPDSLVKVMLSESQFFLGEKKDWNHIDSADVKLYVNGQFKERLAQHSERGRITYEEHGQYYSSYCVRPGDRLRLEVSDGVHHDIVAETEQPYPTESLVLVDSSLVAFDPVVTDDNYLTWWQNPSTGEWMEDSCRVVEMYQDFQYHYSFEFQDNPDREDYYILRFYRPEHGNYNRRGWIEDFSMGEDYIDGNVRLIAGSYYEDLGDEDRFFQDAMFNGKTVRLEFTVNLTDREVKRYTLAGDSLLDHQSWGTNEHYVVSLRPVSRDYYFYWKTYSAWLNDDFQGIFTEPIQIHSNVEDGIGLFGSWCKSDIAVLIHTPMWKPYEERLYYYAADK